MVVAAPAGDGTPEPRQTSVSELASRVWLLREPGSGTRSTTEELFDELGIAPPTLTLGSSGAIRASAQAGLGITLISRDAVARELAEGHLEEWQGDGVRRQREWHLVGRGGEDLPATASLFVAHLVAPGTPSVPPFRAAGTS